jgi:hypothetical protein
LPIAETDVEEADLTDRERAPRGEPSRRDEFTDRLAELEALLTVARSWSKAG